MKKIVVFFTMAALLVGFAAVASAGQFSKTPLDPFNSKRGNVTERTGLGENAVDVVGVNIDSVGVYNFTDFVNGIVYLDGLLYIGAETNGLQILDASDPTSLSLEGSENTYDVTGVAVSGGYAYVGDASGIFAVYDVSDPTTPTVHGAASTVSEPLLTVTVDGGYAYCGSSSGTLYIFDISDPSSPTLSGSLTFASEYAYNVVVEGDTAFVANGKFAFGGDISGLRIVDVTDRTTPTLINSIDFPSTSIVQGVAIDNDLAYITWASTTSGGGLEVYDVSDVDNPTSYGSYAYGDEMRSIAIQGDYAVISAGYSGVMVLDITDAGNDNFSETGSYIAWDYCDQLVVNGGDFFNNASASTIAFDGSAAGLAASVTPSNSLTLDAITSSAFPAVDVDVTVVDQDLAAVTGLTSSEFTISEDASGQTITNVADNGSGSYTISYTTSNTTEDGSSRSVTVDLDNGGLTDSATDSYTAPTAAATELTIGTPTVLTGDTACVPVTVTSFSDVSTLELYINFHPSVVSFDTLTSVPMDEPVFNAAADSVFRVTWSSVTPITLSDGDTLFCMYWVNDALASGDTTIFDWDSGSSFLADSDASVFTGVTYNDGWLAGLTLMNISGNIAYNTNGNVVDGVTVDLTGDATASTTTDENGDYSFSDLEPGTYYVTPSYEVEGHTSVNALDVFRIQQHIATDPSFTDGFQYVASDVDGGTTVSTIDAYKIQRVIVVLDTNFTRGDWNFIPTNYGTNTSNWDSAWDEWAVGLVTDDVTGVNFDGVRIGDVNNTWPNNFVAAKTGNEEVSGNLYLTDATVNPGEATTVELRANGLAEVGVVEFHIEYDPEMISLEDMDLSALPGAVSSDVDGEIHVVWVNVQSALPCDDRTLATFEFQAAETSGASEITLNDVVMGNSQGHELNPAVDNGTVTVSATTSLEGDNALVTEWALRPAYPNPFNAYTTISFDVKDASNVRIQVYNVLGDLVTTLVNDNLAQGRYNASLNANTLSSGTYFVVMKSSGFNKIQKIVLLK
ncbi:T9SS type A sorting domain-containing protein [bacterium]|nr:T9SS type A sorting domain-containing protein [bacterium]